MAINYATLKINEADGTHTITLNRPERRNALNPQMIAELTHALGEAATCPCRVIVLTGAGSAFCSGAALTDSSAAWIRAFVSSTVRFLIEAHVLLRFQPVSCWFPNSTRMSCKYNCKLALALTASRNVVEAVVEVLQTTMLEHVAVVAAGTV